MTTGAVRIPYSDIIALDRDLAYPAMPSDFSFAAALNIVPLLAQELPLAAHHYPIVFLSGGHEPRLAALVGLGDGRNCYVDAEGRWLDGAYIPVWIRSFRREEHEAASGIDKGVVWAGKSEGAALFTDDDATTDRFQASLNYCAEFDAAATATSVFVAAVRDAGLLQDSNLRIERPNAEPHQIDDFSIVSETDLAALPDATVLDFNRRGYLGLIHAHLMSHGSTRQLAEAASGK